MAPLADTTILKVGAGVALVNFGMMYLMPELAISSYYDRPAASSQVLDRRTYGLAPPGDPADRRSFQ